MNLTQIKYVLAVSDYGSITAASRELFVTQPTISQQIKKLEKELGVQLFLRQSRNMILTAAGEGFVAYGRRIINNFEHLTGAMMDYSTHKKGKIRIGMFSTFGSSYLVNKLSLFSKKYPKIETLITVGEGNALQNMLTNHQLDAAFIPYYGDLPIVSDLYMSKMYESQMHVLLPDNHRLLSKDVLDYGDLQEENIVMPSVESNFYSVLQGEFSKNNIAPKVICTTSHPDIMVRMVIENLGIAFGSQFLIKANKDKGVKNRPLKKEIIQSICFAMPIDACELPSNKKFFDFIMEK